MPCPLSDPSSLLPAKRSLEMELKLGLVLEDPETWIKYIYDLGRWDACVLPLNLTSYGTICKKKTSGATLKRTILSNIPFQVS